MCNEASAKKAEFWLRFIAYTIDQLLLSLISILFFIVSFQKQGIDAYSVLIDQNMHFVDTRLVALQNILMLIVVIFYYTYFHGSTGQTVGKKVCKLMVIDKDGDPLGYSKAFFRWIGYFISSVFLCLGFIWAAFDKEKQTWHDKIVGSYVIRV
ncbi:MAG: RDD family protein [Thermodesulfobacteriota bacterium]|nr:RDD family protein [Thermodesulfobacteriota bacterium]